MAQSTYRRREHLRLPFYDYSEYGCYFVTICTKNRQSVFGEIIDGIMQLNTVGEIIKETLKDLTIDYPNSVITFYLVQSR